MTKQEQIVTLQNALKDRIRLLKERSEYLAEQRAKVAALQDITVRENSMLRENNARLLKEITALRDERDWLVANGLKTGKEHDRLRTEYTKLALTWNAFQMLRKDGSREIAMAEARGQLAYEFAKKLLAMNGLDLDSMQLPRREYPDGRG